MFHWSRYMHLQKEACNFIKKRDSGMFSCEFREICKSTFFIEHLRWLLLRLCYSYFFG